MVQLFNEENKPEKFIQQKERLQIPQFKPTNQYPIIQQNYDQMEIFKILIIHLLLEGNKSNSFFFVSITPTMLEF